MYLRFLTCFMFAYFSVAGNSYGQEVTTPTKPPNEAAVKPATGTTTPPDQNTNPLDPSKPANHQPAQKDKKSTGSSDKKSPAKTGKVKTSAGNSGKEKSASDKEVSPTGNAKKNTADSNAAKGNAAPVIPREENNRKQPPLRDASQKTINALQSQNNALVSQNQDLQQSVYNLEALTAGLSVLLLLLVVPLVLVLKKIKRNDLQISANRQIMKSLEDSVHDFEIIVSKNGSPIAPPPPLNNSTIQKLHKIKEKVISILNDDHSAGRKNGERVVPSELKETMVTKLIDYQNPGPGTYIKTEIMVSAGPRKDAGSNDTELGEDVAGSMSLPDQTFFWLLDGTSDGASIKGTDNNIANGSSEASHIFSSRLLAQNLGNYIQQNITRNFTEQLPLNELLAIAKAQVLKEWVIRINNENPERKSSIISLIKKGFKPLCSTTVVIGSLLNNGRLYALRTGDSKVFPFVYNSSNEVILEKNFKFAKDPSEEYDRIAFRLDYDYESAKFIIKTNEHRWLTQTADGVIAAFAFSDGIGRVVETQLATNNPGILEIIKKDIPMIQQKTFDDKSLIILTRIQNN